MDAEQYRAVLARCGGAREEIAITERWRLMQAWREVYAAPYHARAGRWTRGQFEWHVFSFEDVRLPRGKDRRPDFSAVAGDVYVWPPDLAWTMAFTHEQEMGLGPYFSRREWAAG